MFIIIGIKVYESFESDECMRTGIVPENSGDILGGHALLADAYDESDINFKYIEIANSWGDVGDEGFFKIRYDILESCLMDAWVITDLGDVID